MAEPTSFAVLPAGSKGVGVFVLSDVKENEVMRFEKAVFTASVNHSCAPNAVAFLDESQEACEAAIMVLWPGPSFF